jgi:hypothetical protein
MGSVDRRQVSGSGFSCVGVAQSDGGMTAIGQPDNDVGALTMTDGDDRQWLSAKGVMGMGNGHESQRNLGRRGSALGLCRP